MRHRGTRPMNTKDTTVRIPVEQPYDAASLMTFFRQRAIRGVEHIDGLAYRRSVVQNGEIGWLGVEFESEHGYLTVSIDNARTDDPHALQERVAGMFDTHPNASELERCLGADRRLAGLGMRGMRVPGAWDPFELGVRAILGQQVTVSAARTLASRLCEKFGGQAPPAEWAQPLRTFPDPKSLADADIASIGLPRRRAETVRSFARAIATGRIDFQTRRGRREAPANLLGIPGIGQWTVGYITMRALKDPDAFPTADIALVRAAQRLGIADDAPSLERASERWRPWRAYAAVRLWTSLSAK